MDHSNASFVARINCVLERFERLAMWVACVAMVAMMLLIVTDVVARYFLRAPLSWSFDLISLYLMPVAFFMALADTLHKGQHIGVDLVVNTVPKRASYAMYALGMILSLVVFAGFSWSAAVISWEDFKAGSVTSGLIPWPTWIYSAVMFLGCFLLLLRGVMRSLVFILAFWNGRDPSIPEQAHSDVEEI